MRLYCSEHTCYLKQMRVYDERKQGGYKTIDLLYCEVGDHVLRAKLKLEPMEITMGEITNESR